MLSSISGWHRCGDKLWGADTLARRVRFRYDPILRNLISSLPTALSPAGAPRGMFERHRI